MSRIYKTAITFPALAGYLIRWLDEVGSLTLVISATSLVGKGLPRTRGDEPLSIWSAVYICSSAPHSRG